MPRPEPVIIETLPWIESRKDKLFFIFYLNIGVLEIGLILKFFKSNPFQDQFQPDWKKYIAALNLQIILIQLDCLEYA